MTVRRRHLLAGTAAAAAMAAFRAAAQQPPLGNPFTGLPPGSQPQATAARPARPPQPEGREALLIPGKRSLRQRVLSRPGAAYSSQPGGPPAGSPINPLTPLFVFARQAAPDGTPWMEVGLATRGVTMGWLAEERTIPWRHTMTAAFHNPAGRERTLFFRDRDSLLAMLGGAHPAQEAHSLATAAQRTPRPADFPVVAMEPPEYVDIRRQFYLLPILQAESIALQDGREYRMLEVASIPLANQAAAPAPFTMGLAFVVDTTLSMDPYINKVRAALTDVVRGTAAEAGAPTRYALIGFRNSLTAQPRLEYLNQTFARFADSTDADGFIKKIAAVKATTVDSLSFNEDSFAAVAAAIDGLDWGEIQGRVVVLVTDAGSRPPNDPLSATGMGPEELGNKARAAGVALMVLHLRSPAGANNHGFAERQYTALTSVPLPTLGPQYFPVPNGDAEALDRQVRDMLGKLRAVRADQSAAQASRTPPNPADRAAMVGHALRLAWLGRQDRAQAPDLVRAWAADGYRGTNPPENLEVRVLLTRNQLNDLAQSLRFIIDQGRANLLDSNAMFERLQTVAAHLARDPDGLRQRGLENPRRHPGRIPRRPALRVGHRHHGPRDLAQHGRRRPGGTARHAGGAAAPLPGLQPHARALANLRRRARRGRGCLSGAAIGPAVSGQPLLAVRGMHVTRRAGEYEFRLDIPHFTLRAGGRAALLGKSGSGKSTMLDLLAMALPPDAAAHFMFNPHGTSIDLAAAWRGGPAAQDRTRAHHIGYVLQTGGLLPFLSVRHNIALPAEIAGRTEPGRVEELAARLGVAHHLARMPHALSVGERQRVAIARALVHRPPLVLADEPTSALDPALAVEVMDLLLAETQAEGAALIVATHDHDAAERYALPIIAFEITRAAHGAVAVARPMAT